MVTIVYIRPDRILYHTVPFLEGDIYSYIRIYYNNFVPFWSKIMLYGIYFSSDRYI